MFKKNTTIVSLAITLTIIGLSFVSSNTQALAAERITNITQSEGCLPSKSGNSYCRKQTHWRGTIYCKNGKVLTAQQSKFQRDHNGNWDIQSSSGHFYEFGGMNKADRACNK